MTKIYIKHIRSCNYCMKGFKAFCKERNWNYKSFLKSGIEIKDLRVLLNGEKHTLIERAIKLAEKDGL